MIVILKVGIYFVFHLAANTGNNGSPPSGGLKDTIINNSPNIVLKTIAAGTVIKDRYSHLIPQLASYFLPVGK